MLWVQSLTSVLELHAGVCCESSPWHPSSSDSTRPKTFTGLWSWRSLLRVSCTSVASLFTFAHMHVPFFCYEISSRHQIACFKATVRSPPPSHRAAVSQQYSVARLLVLSCLYSLCLRCSCCNVVWFCCDLEACSLVMAVVIQDKRACHHGMARPEVVDGADGFQIWKVAANILNK
jgi:hypothetical protein